MRRISALTLVAAIGLGAMGCASSAKSTTTPPSDQVQTEPQAVPIAEGFVTALGTYQTDEALGYLADGADLVDLAGVTTPERLPLLTSWFKATGYQQRNIACAETATLPSGTDVRCTFDFHAIRSAEIGRGPYGGSSYDLTIRDDRVQSASISWETEKFSPQMWEPFADWIAKTYPEDGAVMYTPNYSDFQLSKESIRLWEQHTMEYVKLVGR